MRALPALLLALSAPAMAQTQADLAGSYDGGQMEMAAGLELSADGRFHYALVYGAAEETAEGRWRTADGRVYLDTEPAVVPPGFVVEAEEPAPAGQLVVTLADPGFDWGKPLDVLLRVEGDDELYLTHADDKGRVSYDPKWTVTGVTPALPVYDILPPVHAIPGGEGRRIRFRFEPNDAGRADFRGEALAIEGGDLLLRRYDRTVRFRKMPAE